MFPKPHRLPTVGPSGSLPVRLSAVLTVLVLVPACAGCGPSAGSGQGAPEEGAGQARDVVEETAAAATGQALAGSDWSSYNVFFAVPDDAIALSISFPADWVASYSDAGVSVGNAVADDASSLSDGELDAQLDIEIVGDDRCGEASDLDESASRAPDADQRLGAPVSKSEPPPDAPWEESWTLDYQTCHRDRPVYASAHLCCTTDRAVADVYLDVLGRVADSVRFVDLPLADRAWEADFVQNGRVRLDRDSDEPGRTQYDEWWISHPPGWSLVPADPDSLGWQLTMPLAELVTSGAGAASGGSQVGGSEVVLLLDPATNANWGSWDSGTSVNVASSLGTVRHIPDATSENGLRQVRYLIDSPYGQRWVLTADLPGPDDDDDLYEYVDALALHVLLRASFNRAIQYDEGYPGRP